MKRTYMIMLAAVLLVGSSLGCRLIPQLPKIELPDIDINVPTVEVGDTQDEGQTIPLGGATAATVDVLFGAGALELGAGASDQLFSGHFVYNVEQWAPEVTYADGTLSVRQGGDEGNWGLPSGDVRDIRNEWDLDFSPAIPLEIDLRIGAGQGAMDFTGLQLTNLDIDMGAGDFEVRFDEPNAVQMGRLTLDAGASRLVVTGVGNAGPDHMTVQGGAGDITLDFAGNWRGPADVSVTAGIGALTLRLPNDVGVEVEIEGGLSNVEAGDFEKRGGTYVNGAFDTAETKLHIEVKVGIGNVRLVEVSGKWR